MEPGSSLQCLHEHAGCSYPEPAQSSLLRLNLPI
jgi:hypothetical protein